MGVLDIVFIGNRDTCSIVKSTTLMSKGINESPGFIDLYDVMTILVLQLYYN